MTGAPFAQGKSALQVGQLGAFRAPKAAQGFNGYGIPRLEYTSLNFGLVVIRAPKGQLPLAQGIALGYQVHPRTAP